MALKEMVPVLAFAAVIFWQRHVLRTSMGIKQLKDSVLRRAFTHTMMWSALAGVSFGGGLLWTTASLMGVLPKMPTWAPANVNFIPMVFAIFCATKAAHPPFQRSAPVDIRFDT